MNFLSKVDVLKNTTERFLDFFRSGQKIKTDGTLISYRPEETQNKYVNLSASQAQVGDKVFGSDGPGTITNIISDTLELHQTYIITVQDNENFFAENTLVHNK